MTQRIQHRRDTTANWTSANPVLSPGEIGIELNGTTGAVVGVRVGDGTKTWTQLDRYATMADVTAAINAIVDGAPGLLDTLNELAAALGDDPNFIATMAEDLAGLDARVRETKMAVIKNDYRHGDERGDVPAAYWLSKRQPLNAADHDLVNLDGNLLTGRDLWLKEATALWMADGHDGGSLLLDKASNRHHLQMGSTHVATVVPAPHADSGLLLPGQPGRYASAPDRAEYDITGDLDLIVHCALNGWNTHTASQDLLSKWGTSNAYLLRVDSGGSLRLYWSHPTAGDQAQVATANIVTATGVTGGEDLWLRATLDVNNGSGGHTVKFYTSSDGENWTQLGNTIVGAGVTEVGVSTAAINVGAQNDGGTAPTKGFIYRAIVKDGINGTPVFDADFTKQPHGTTSFQEDALGATVTINGTTGADTNDPLWLGLEPDEDAYLYLPRVAGNNASTPSASELNLTSFDIVAWVEHPTWRPPEGQRIVAKINGASVATGGGYELYLNSNGALLAQISDGTSNANIGTTVLPFVAGEGGWVRVVHDMATKTVIFYYSKNSRNTNPTKVSWTQLGNPLTHTLTTVASNTIPLVVGDLNGLPRLFEGKIARVQVRNGNGTLVADFDPSRSRQPHRNFVDSVGNVWTINRSTSGRKAALVDQPMFLLGTDDYMEAPDHDDLDFGAGQNFTVVAAFREHRQPGSVAIVTKKATFDGTTAGWSLIYAMSSDMIEARYANSASAGTIAAAPRTRTSILGGTHVLAGRRDGTNFTTLINASSGTASNPSSIDLRTVEPVRIGRLGGTGTAYADMEFIGAAIFRRALTDAEIEEVSREFGWAGPPTSLLDEAVVAAVAGVNDGQRLIDITGRGHNFTLGSTSGADTNDPLILPYTGEKYVYLPGQASDYVSPGVIEAINNANKIVLTVRVAPDLWETGANYPHLLSSYQASQGIALYIGGERIRMAWYDHSGTSITAPSGGTMSVVDPDAFQPRKRLWVRGTLICDDGAGGHLSRIEYSEDGVDWNIFHEVTTAGTTSVLQTNANMRLGSRGAAGFPMKAYRAIVELDDVVVADFDANNATEPYATVAGGAGETWTFNRSATGRKLAVVDQNLLLFGTDDYAEAPDDDELDFGASDSFTALVLARMYDFENYVPLIAKRAGGGAAQVGWYFFTPNNWRYSAEIADGTVQIGPVSTPVSASAIVKGVRHRLAGVRNKTAGQLSIYADDVVQTATDTTGSLVNALPVRIGGGSTTAGGFDAEVMGVAIVRRALSAAELTQLANELIAANNNPGRYLLPKPVSQYLMEA